MLSAYFDVLLIVACYELLRIVAVTNCRCYELSPLRIVAVTNCRLLRIVACYELSHYGTLIHATLKLDFILGSTA